MQKALFTTLTLLTASAANAQIELEKVIDTNTLIPGAAGDTFAGIDEPPSLSNGTILAAFELPSTSGFVEGLFSVAPDGTITEYARTGGSFPDGSGNVASSAGFGSRGYDISGGNVLFSPRRNTSSVRTITTVFGGTATAIVEHGVTPIPDGSGDVFNNLADSDAIALSGQNFVFEDVGTPTGIYAYIGGSLVTIAQEDDASPGGSTFASGFDEPDIDGTNIVFEADTNDNADGIYAAIGSNIFAVATEQDNAPGGTGTFSFTDNPQILGSNIVFLGDDALDVEGVYLAEITGSSVTSLTQLVEVGDAVPGLSGVTFSDMDKAGIGDGGDLVVFEADFDSFSEDGIFAIYQGNLINVIDSTQTLDGKAIASFNFDGEGVDGNQIAFEVRFDDGSEAIYLATIPEPSSLALLGLGGLLAARRRR